MNIELQLIGIYFTFFFMMISAGSLYFPKLVKQFDSQIFTILAYVCFIFNFVFLSPALIALHVYKLFPFVVISLIFLTATVVGLIQLKRHQTSLAR